MGGSVSSATQVNSKITEIITEKINENVSSCAAASSSSQKINISNLTLEGCNLEFSDIGQTIDSNIDLTCVLEANNLTKIKSNIENALDSEIKQATSGLTFGANVNVSNIKSDIKEKIMNTIINKNIIDCSVNKANEQLISISNLKVLNCPAIAPTVKISNLKQFIISNAVSKCTGEIINQDDLDNISKNVTKLSSKSSIEGISGSQLSSVSLSVFIIIGIFLVILVLLSAVSSSTKGPGGAIPQFTPPFIPQFTPSFMPRMY